MSCITRARAARARRGRGGAPLAALADEVQGRGEGPHFAPRVDRLQHLLIINFR